MRALASTDMEDQDKQGLKMWGKGNSYFRNRNNGGSNSKVAGASPGIKGIQLGNIRECTISPRNVKIGIKLITANQSSADDNRSALRKVFQPERIVVFLVLHFCGFFPSYFNYFKYINFWLLLETIEKPETEPWIKYFYPLCLLHPTTFINFDFISLSKLFMNGSKYSHINLKI